MQDKIVDLATEQSATKESVKSAHKRINELNERGIVNDHR